LVNIIFLQIGTVLAPHIVELGISIGDSSLPPAIFGALMLAASAVFVLVPETRGRPLTQSLADMDAEGHGQTILMDGCRIKK